MKIENETEDIVLRITVTQDERDSLCRTVDSINQRLERFRFSDDCINLLDKIVYALRK